MTKNRQSGPQRQKGRSSLPRCLPDSSRRALRTSTAASTNGVAAPTCSTYSRAAGPDACSRRRPDRQRPPSRWQGRRGDAARTGQGHARSLRHRRAVQGRLVSGGDEGLGRAVEHIWVSTPLQNGRIEPFHSTPGRGTSACAALRATRTPRRTWSGPSGTHRHQGPLVNRALSPDEFFRFWERSGRGEGQA